MIHRPFFALFLAWMFILNFASVSAQVWETVRLENFSAAGSPPALANIADLYHAGLNLSTNGASGGASDNCAAGLWIPGRYIAMRHDLSTAYEYKITWNCKAGSIGKTLQFAYGPSAGLTGLTNIGGIHSIVKTTVSEPGEDIVSARVRPEFDVYLRQNTTKNGSTVQIRARREHKHNA